MESPPPAPEPPPTAPTPTPKKGKYSTETRQRVVDCAREGGYRRALAQALKVPLVVARTWVRRYADGPDDTARKRGGSEKLLTADHAEFMCTELDKNNKLTLAELAPMLEGTFRISCSISTVSRALEGACYTLKKTHVQPQYMNTEINKVKRRDFLRKLLEYMSHGCRIYYVDETNLNLWTARTQGRSPKGQRCVQEKVASGGKNMHVTACISEGGLVYYENQFGSNRAPDVNEFLSNMLRVVHDEQRQPLNRVIVVLDNAPCHTDVESVFEQGEFAASDVLRLGPIVPSSTPSRACSPSSRQRWRPTSPGRWRTCATRLRE